MERKEGLTRRKYIQQKKKRRKKKLLSFVAMLMLLFMVGVITLFGYTYWKVIGAFQEISETSSTKGNKANAAESEHQPPASEEGEEEGEKPFAVAIIGIDSRSGSGGSLNSDVLMVAFVDPSDHQVRLLSIPRDLKMSIPGYSGYRKANQAYALGESSRIKAERNNKQATVTGASLVQEMLAEYLQVPIQYYVSVDFRGFKEVVDSIGGVKVNVKRHMVYDDPTDGTHIRLAPGEQTLDGKNALDYVRFRLDNYGNHASDMDRNMRQQEVLRGLLDKLISLEGATKLGAVLDAVSQHTTTNFSVDELKGFLWDVRSYSQSQIHTIETEAYWDSRQLFTIIPEENLEEIRREIKTFMKIAK